MQIWKPRHTINNGNQVWFGDNGSADIIKCWQLTLTMTNKSCATDMTSVVPGQWQCRDQTLVMDVGADQHSDKCGSMATRCKHNQVFGIVLGPDHKKGLSDVQLHRDKRSSMAAHCKERQPSARDRP